MIFFLIPLRGDDNIPFSKICCEHEAWAEKFSIILLHFWSQESVNGTFYENSTSVKREPKILAYNDLKVVYFFTFFPLNFTDP